MSFLFVQRHLLHSLTIIILGHHNYLKCGAIYLWGVKVKSSYEPIVAHQGGAYPGFCSMKRLGVFLLPPVWDASPSQGYPQH